jgi:hypothetical protein
MSLSGAAMKLWAIPVLAAAMLVTDAGDEPSERQMRRAFEGLLSLQVRNALEFAEDAGGAEAVARIRENGTDAFMVNAFQKVRCRPQAGTAVYLCDFRVEIGLISGPLERNLTGRFFGGPHNLVVIDEV